MVAVAERLLLGVVVVVLVIRSAESTKFQIVGLNIVCLLIDFPRNVISWGWKPERLWRKN